jgi:predicted nucleotidyltransferase component of viral defense system
MTEAVVPLNVHEDVGLFREAVTFTAAQTRFSARLIEKDYFCSLALQYLAARAPGLVFRGGTSLAKVHLGFYRLSEDLDFLVSTPVEASRAERSGRADELKRAIAAVDKDLRGFRVVTPVTGANDSRQYNAVIAYKSLMAQREENLKIEVGFREPVIEAVVNGKARTLLLSPLNGESIAPVFPVRVLSRDEAMAEKVRAALSRREVAIRDFYDVDHAEQRFDLRPDNKAVLYLVRLKLAVAGNEEVDVSGDRLAALKRQLDAELRPVLREDEFAAFDLDRAFRTVAGVAAALRGSETERR